ncbi:STAS domain-containing protein [Deferribacteres bacterium DY0037]
MDFSKEFIKRSEKKILVCCPKRAIDAAIGKQIRADIENCLSDFDALILNFSEVNRLDSEGLRELVLIIKLIKNNDKMLFLTALQDEVRDVFEKTSLIDILKILKTNEDAIKLLR